MSKQRVLILDRDPALQATLASAVHRAGGEAIALGNAEAACVALGAAPATLVVLDLGLPALDTPALIGALHERQPALPILVQTSPGAIPLAARVAPLPHTELVARPLSVEQLTSTLVRLAHAQQDELHEQAEAHIKDILGTHGW